MGQNAKYTEAQLDLRVRNRHLASGLLEPKAVRAMIAALPDLETQSESIDLRQPALLESDDDDGEQDSL